MDFENKLNSFTLDWCHSCAVFSLRGKSKAKKIFAYTFIEFAKANDSVLENYISWKVLKENRVELKFEEDLFKMWDLYFYSKDKYCSRNYKFLDMIIKDHIVRSGSKVKGKIKYRFVGKSLSILIEVSQ